MSLEREYPFYSYDAYPSSHVKMSSVLKAMQQVAREDLDKFGLTYPVMRKDNLVFVLIKLRVKFHSPITVYDKIIIETIPTALNGIYFMRDFFFRNDKGELVGEASSSWVLLNYETRRPQRPSALNFDIPHSDDNTADCPLSRNIQCAGMPVSENVRQVLLSDMDENNHLNNAIIADFITDEFSDEILFRHKDIKDLEIHFRKESRFSQKLKISKFKIDNSSAEIRATFYDTEDVAFEGCLKFFDF